jgi:hypothetical protein
VVVIATPLQVAAVWAVGWVVGLLAVVVGGLVAVDWFTAGRTKRRMVVRAKDQGESDTAIGYGTIQNQSHGSQFGTWGM